MIVMTSQSLILWIDVSLDKRLFGFCCFGMKVCDSVLNTEHSCIGKPRLRQLLFLPGNE